MVRINPALIPETETKLLAMTFLDGIRKFYSDPKMWKNSMNGKDVGKQKRHLRVSNQNITEL